MVPRIAFGELDT
jgi:hypothetical protein